VAVSPILYYLNCFRTTDGIPSTSVTQIYSRRAVPIRDNEVSQPIDEEKAKSRPDCGILSWC